MPGFLCYHAGSAPYMPRTHGTLIPLQSGNGGGSVEFVASVVVLAVVIAGLWKAFEKAGEPGWAAVVPFYNLWVMVRVSDNAWWWFVLFLIPIAQIVALIKVSIDVSKQFGQGLLFGVGLWLVPVVFWPLLGFGDYEYRDRAPL